MVDGAQDRGCRPARALAPRQISFTAINTDDVLVSQNANTMMLCGMTPVPFHQRYPSVWKTGVFCLQIVVGVVNFYSIPNYGSSPGGSILFPDLTKWVSHRGRCDVIVPPGVGAAGLG
jgi:hypothetical protein